MEIATLYGFSNIRTGQARSFFKHCKYIMQYLLLAMSVYSAINIVYKGCIKQDLIFKS